MRVIGIDPGAEGALAFLDTASGDIQFFSTPGENTPETSVLQWLQEFSPEIIGLEKVHSVPGTSAKSNFNFGYNVGTITTLTALLECPVLYLRPKDWQSEVGLSIPKKLKSYERKKAIKQFVCEKCLELYPGADLFGPRGGLIDGRSDALMIAHVTAQRNNKGNS